MSYCILPRPVKKTHLGLLVLRKNSFGPKPPKPSVTFLPVSCGRTSYYNVTILPNKQERIFLPSRCCIAAPTASSQSPCGRRSRRSGSEQTQPEENMKPKKKHLSDSQSHILVRLVEGPAGFQDMPAMASPVTTQLDLRGMKSPCCG